MISLLNKSQRPLATSSRLWINNVNPTNTRLFSSAAGSSTSTTQTHSNDHHHHQASSSKDDSERLLDMYNNEKQSVLDELDHPDNKGEEATVSPDPESDANSVFDE
ncbi:hypothetical protein BCR42DRAFT_405623 [Absidia repens]|uniref:Uncharacterized protein n=1 Tax=Absidia repens TaxID=90262 RepID=A0A1X2ITM5_9FUNG|nr:hypothetical protein BCR42DRAFT_405623 [Absidia repens]